MTTGQKIRYLRTQKGITLEELAQLIGTTRQTISKYERGLIDISHGKLVQIAKALNVSPSSLIEWPTSEESSLESDTVDLDNLGVVAGGIPIDAIEDRAPKFSITAALARTGQYATFDIKGNSMAPLINDGDVVLVKYQPTVSSGDVAIIYLYDYQATCKQIFFLENGSIKVKAYNENVYATKTYTRAELQEMNFRILGKVVLVVRNKF